METRGNFGSKLGVIPQVFTAASAFTLAQSIALWEISTPVKEAQGESIPRSKSRVPLPQHGSITRALTVR